MQAWHDTHVLSTVGWTEQGLTPLLDRAAHYKKLLARKSSIRTRTPLNLLTLFFEASTRTRLSFESAAYHLGMNVLSVADAAVQSSSRKGETLRDTARTVSAYAHAVVIRHPEVGSAHNFAAAATVPVINAGDGAGEHPTQALVDVFTIREAFGSLRGLRVGLCGDLRHGRTVHSLLRLLIEFGCEVTTIAPDDLALPVDVAAGLSVPIRDEPDLRAALPDLDVVYLTRVQKERFEGVYEQVRDIDTLTATDLKSAPDHLRVLHPLPRIDEIAPCVDDSPHALYFTQSANGVPVRMALLSAIIGPDEFTVGDYPAAAEGIAA